jgi:hypothetical protein
MSEGFSATDYARVSLTDEDRKIQEQAVKVYIENYASDEDKETYASMPSRAIKNLIKVADAVTINYLLHSNDSVTSKNLASIAKKYRKPAKFRKYEYPRNVWHESRRINLLSAVALHPLTAEKNLKELFKEGPSPVKLAVTQNPLLLAQKKQELYAQIIETQADGNISVLLRTILAPDLPWNLVNKGLQDLFNKGEYVIFSFPSDQNRKYFSYEMDQQGNRLHRSQEEWSFAVNLGALSARDGISMKTMKSIIASGHSQAILSLCGNKYLTGKMYEYLAESQGFLNLEAKPSKYIDERLPAFAGNTSVPPAFLASITDSVLPELSYKRRGAVYNQTAASLANNPNTPLKSLLTLRSLHNDVEYQKYVATGVYNWEAEISGTPWELRYAVENNPRYLQWVEENPNYKDLLPEFIPCPCHGL